jgi:uncharacterized protein YxjI
MSQNALNSITAELNGKEEILMKKKIVALGKHYNVMDKDKNNICSVHLSWGQNLGGESISQYGGKWIGRSMKYTYKIKDNQDELALEVKKYAGSWKTSFEVVEPETGTIIGKILLKRSFLIGGIKARWTKSDSDDPVMTVKGNVMRRKYLIVGSDGKEIAKIRHKIVAVRDVWPIKLYDKKMGLQAIIFAAVLDFEKEM